MKNPPQIPEEPPSDPLDYVIAGMAIKRFAQRLPNDQPLAKIVQIAESKLVEM